MEAMDDMAAFVGDHAMPELPTMLVESESMDLTNDPRFFRHTTLDKRLKAFHSLSLVSGIMVGTSFMQCVTMPKAMNLALRVGWAQLAAFWCFSIAVFNNVYCLFILVQQLFFTYRLLTAGPTGFEIAASFYLNRNIIQHRHLAVKALIYSLPIFVLGAALRMSTLFYLDAANAGAPLPNPEGDPSKQLDMKVHEMLAGIVVGVWLSVSLCMYLAYRRHINIFRERYMLVKDKERPLLSHISKMSQRTGTGLLDT